MKPLSSPEPPQLVLRFFRWFCNPAYQEDIEGDLREIYERKVAEAGRKKAAFKFTIDVLKLFRPSMMRSFFKEYQLNNYGMFKNYLITALRNMRKEKMFAVMNIMGLALGIGCALAIYQIVTYETSFDRYHHNSRNIYRLINSANDPNAGLVYFPGQVHPLGEALRNDFAGVTAVMTFYAEEGQITIDNKDGEQDKYHETEGLTYAEPELFKIFDFKFIAGDPKTALSKPGSVVLTSSLAKKYFKVSDTNMQDALGKSLVIENKKTMKVTGVITDTPDNTDLPFKIIGSYSDQDASNPYYGNGTNWHEYNGGTNCYVLVTEGMQPSGVEKQLKAFQIKYSGKETADKLTLHLQPLTELHTSALINNYRKHQVTMPMLLTLIIIGAFLVVTAAINFINLSTAQAVQRSKEIGIRKSMGGTRGQLMVQHLGETLLTALFSTIVGFVIAEGLFIYLQNILGYQLGVDDFLNFRTLIFVTALMTVVGLLSGFYPALVMAGMNPVKALKNSLAGSNRASGLLSVRRTLVVVQFVISQVLIIGTIVVHAQMDYFLSADLGFNKDAVVIARLPEGVDSARLVTLKNQLLKRSDIVKVTYETRSPMADWNVQNPLNFPGLPPDEHQANLKTADEDYLDLYQIKLIAGTNYTASKSFENAVVNRKLTQTLGFDDPGKAVGEKFKYGSNFEFKIVGVVEDFHAYSLQNKLDNVIFANVPFNIKEVAVKLNTKGAGLSDINETLRGIEKDWNTSFPDRIFDFKFYDQELHQMYSVQEKISDLSTLFSVIAIVIGSLGLYALISYLANQKTKEIGIRKVLGATLLDIQLIFSKEMLIMIFVAFAIAAPIGYYAMNQWLQSFEYKITISPLIFLSAVLVSIIVAGLTIGYKAYSASNVNPVDSLKQE